MTNISKTTKEKGDVQIKVKDVWMADEFEKYIVHN